MQVARALFAENVLRREEQIEKHTEGVRKCFVEGGRRVGERCYIRIEPVGELRLVGWLG